MASNGFEGIDLYRGGNGFFNEYAPMGTRVNSTTFTSPDNVTKLPDILKGSAKPPYEPVVNADALARYNQQIANARNLQLARLYIQPQDLGNGYVSKFNPETGKFELRFNNKIIGREYYSMDEINRLVNASRPTSKPDPNPTPKPDHKPAQRSKIKSPALVEFEKQWSKEAIQKKVAAYRKAMEKQGLKGEQLEEQVARYKEGLQAERAKALNKLKGKAKARGIASGKIKVKPQVTPKPEGKGFIGKSGKFFKGKGGRAALIGAGILAAGALVACLLKGCSKDGADEAATDPKTPAAEDVPKETAPETPGVVDGPKETDPAKDDQEAKTGTFKAIPGSFEWRFAERELLLEHLGEANYKPSATEISQRAAEIAARDNRKIDNTGHSVDENGKWVQVGEDMILTEQIAQLANEARAQLIQEHKDQKDYEPSWAEIRKIVDKKIQDLQAEALKPAA